MSSIQHYMTTGGFILSALSAELDKEIDIRESLSSIVIKVPGRVDNIERNSKIRINFDKTKIHLFRNDNDKEDSILGETIGQ